MASFFKPTWVDAVIIAVVIAVTVIWQNVDGNSSSTGSSSSSTAVATEQANTSSSSSQGSSGSGAASAPLQSNTPPEDCKYVDEYDRIRGSIVQIWAESDDPEWDSFGTGFHIGDGIYITALHVIDYDFDARSFSGTVSPKVQIGSWLNQKIFSAQVIGKGDYDLDTESGRVGRDLAILKAAPIPDSIKYRFANESDMSSDTRYLVFGFPSSALSDNPDASTPEEYLLSEKPSRKETSITKIVEGETEYISHGQVDTGMSGGPLIDECGAALAVISWGRDDSSSAFSISMREYEKIR